MNKTTLNALALFPLQLETHYAAIPEEFRHWAPPNWEGVPSEPFTAIEQICHVRDIEIDGYQERFRRTLHEEHPLLPSIDSETLAVERDYARADAIGVLSEFHEARARTVAMISALGKGDLSQSMAAAMLDAHTSEGIADDASNGVHANGVVMRRQAAHEHGWVAGLGSFVSQVGLQGSACHHRQGQQILATGLRALKRDGTDAPVDVGQLQPADLDAAQAQIERQADYGITAPG